MRGFFIKSNGRVCAKSFMVMTSINVFLLTVSIVTHLCALSGHTAPFQRLFPYLTLAFIIFCIPFIAYSAAGYGRQGRDMLSPEKWDGLLPPCSKQISNLLACLVVYGFLVGIGLAVCFHKAALADTVGFSALFIGSFALALTTFSTESERQQKWKDMNAAPKN